MGDFEDDFFRIVVLGCLFGQEPAVSASPPPLVAAGPTTILHVPSYNSPLKVINNHLIFSTCCVQICKATGGQPD